MRTHVMLASVLMGSLPVLVTSNWKSYEVTSSSTICFAHRNSAVANVTWGRGGDHTGKTSQKYSPRPHKTESSRKCIRPPPPRCLLDNDA